MSSSNAIFVFMILLGPMLGVSTSSWFISWVGLELSFMGFIPMLFNDEVSTNKEAAMKYFCIQAFASALLLISGLNLYYGQSASMVFLMMLLYSLCVKLGTFPGHYWVPSVSVGISWLGCMLMLGPMKIVPFQMLSNYCLMLHNQEFIVIGLGAISAVVGAILGNNMTTLRGMVGASSVAHSGWLFMAAPFGTLWIYLSIYMVVLMITLGYMKDMDKTSSGLWVLSMSGIPPFVMFMVKLLVLVDVMWINISSALVIVLPILGTVISLIFYLKFSYSLLLSETKTISMHSVMVFNGINLFSVVCVFLLMFFGGW